MPPRHLPEPDESHGEASHGEPAPHTSSRGRGGVLRNSAFRGLWLTSGVSFVALTAYLLFEQWYVVRELGRPSALGLVMATTVGARLLLMSLGGVAVDRFRASRVAMWSALSRMALVGVMMGFMEAGWLTVTALVVLGTLYGACDAFFTPAIGALAPRLVPPEQLRPANAVVLSGNQAGMIAGPLVGAALLAVSYSATLAGVMVLLSVAAMSVGWVNDPPPARPKTPESLAAQVLSGWRQIRRIPSAWDNLLIIVAVNLFFFGPLLMGVPLLVAENPESTPRDLGVLQGAYAVGMMGGAGLSAVRAGPAWLVRALLPLLGACLLGVALTPHLVQVALMVVMGVISSVINVLILTNIQQNTGTAIIGRVMALVTIASSGTIPISYAILGALVAAGFTGTAVIVAAGGCVIAIGAAFCLWRALYRAKPTR